MTARPTDGLLRAEGLVKSYRGRRVVDGVSFHVAPGEVVGLLGPNGAGKTTFLRILASLSRPSLGAVSVAGYPLPKEAASVRARLGDDQVEGIGPDVDGGYPHYGS